MKNLVNHLVKKLTNNFNIRQDSQRLHGKVYLITTLVDGHRRISYENRAIRESVFGDGVLF